MILIVLKNHSGIVRRQGEASKQQLFCSASRFVGEMGTFKAASLAALIKLLSCACLHNDRRSQSAKINGCLQGCGGWRQIRHCAMNEELAAIIDGLSCCLRLNGKCQRSFGFTFGFMPFHVGQTRHENNKVSLQVQFRVGGGGQVGSNSFGSLRNLI